MVKERKIAALFILLLFIGALLFSQLFPGMIKLELSVYDAKLRSCSNKLSAPSPIIIADIDESSYGSLPDVWPWPRSYYARLINNLNRAGAKLIVIDIILDKQSQSHPSGDTELVKALEQYSNVILSAKNIVENNKLELLTPYTPFRKAANENWGFINVQEGIDRIVRDYYYGLTDPFGIIHPSLAVAAFRMLKPDAASKLPPLGIFPVAFFHGEKAFPTIPIFQIIDDSTFITKDEEDFAEEINLFDTLKISGVLKDKVVFVGASIEELHDRIFTPYASINRNTTGSGIPGVEVHATALHTLLSDNKIHAFSLEIYWLILLLISVIIFIVGSHSRILISTLFTILLVALSVFVNITIFRMFLIQLPLVPALITITVTYAGQQAYLFYQERKKRRQITNMFGHYVPKEVVSELIKDPTKMKLGGERRELSVLFSDIAGFTSLSENMEPEQLILLLNEYLSEMTDIVHAHSGIIDKYEGDAIMAEFGIPLLMPDHALRACNAAFAMQKKLYELGVKWASEGRPVLTARIGIGTGNMVFGNMGSNQAFDYTVIGDVVNLTSRLEGANKVYGTKIIVNEAAYEQSKEFMLARELDLIRVKGKIKPVKCFQLMAPKSSPKASEIEKVITIFSQGLIAYRNQEWEKAVDKFNSVLNLWSDDMPSKVYIDRCDRFIRVNPGKTWDGVFSQTSK